MQWRATGRASFVRERPGSSVVGWPVYSTFVSSPGSARKVQLASGGAPQTFSLLICGATVEGWNLRASQAGCSADGCSLASARWPRSASSGTRSSHWHVRMLVADVSMSGAPALNMQHTSALDKVRRPVYPSPSLPAGPKLQDVARTSRGHRIPRASSVFHSIYILTCLNWSHQLCNATGAQLGPQGANRSRAITGPQIRSA
jgi:hypothetical protein